MQTKLISVLKRIVILADFKTVEKKFLDQGIAKEEAKEYLDAFKKLRDTNRISDKSKKDIEYWGKKEFSQFKDFVDTLTATKSKRKQKKSVHKEAMNIGGATLVAENDDWLVYRILEYSACKLLGSRNWCIVRDESTWDDYTDIGVQNTDDPNNYFYFILAKDRPEDEWYKIAVQSSSENEITVWDALDKDRSWGQFINSTKDLNIPEFNIEHPEKCHECGKHSDYCTCCGICGRDSDGCECCHDCENTLYNCTCCPICGDTDRDHCGCCPQCEEKEGACTCCSDCGNIESRCTCDEDDEDEDDDNNDDICSDCGQLKEDCDCDEKD
jgi:hypothetical protein